MGASALGNGGFLRSVNDFLELEEATDRNHFGKQIGELLYCHHMHEYIPIFCEENIGIDLFLNFDKDDLTELGVKSSDISKMLELIKCYRRNPIAAQTENVQKAHTGVEPEPEMSMENILEMQANTSKQLKKIIQMIEIIEVKLKENKFNNTLIDTKYCAAHALNILCTELVRQADILVEESKNLEESLLKRFHQDKEKKTQRRSCFALMFAASVIGFVIMWKYPRK